MIHWAVTSLLWLWLAVTQYSPHHQVRRQAEYLPFIEVIRSAFGSINDGLSDDASALVAGLAIGDDSALSEKTALAMQTVGLSHLTAVSGANCAIVIALVYLLLKQFALSRIRRALLATVSLGFYVLLVGPEPSVLRSSLMATVVLFVVAAGRPASAPAALAAATFALLVVIPSLATSIGFALSVCATLGILILAPALNEILNQKLPSWISIALAVSLAAQVSCWPVLLLIQDGVSTYSIVANLLVEPLVAPITIIGLAACLIAVPLPQLAHALAWVASVFSYPIAGLANWLHGLPQSTLSWPTGWLGICLAAIIVTLIALWLRSGRQRVRWLSAAALLVAGALFFGSNSASIVRSNTWMKGSWDIVACDVGQGDALVLQSQGRTALIDVGKSDNAINECLSKLGIERIDLLVLTHYDLDHVGGLNGAIDGRQVSLAMVTEFNDDRPAKKYVDEALSEARINVIGAEENLSGKLGEIEWTVIGPKHLATEAEDSNDASTIILFSGPYFDLLTLADLGERGQRRIAPRLGSWVSSNKPLILKVSHHGSADQYPELTEALAPDYALISVGQGNSYGHPTDRTLALLRQTGAVVLRTDQLGSIAIDTERDEDPVLKLRASG